MLFTNKQTNRQTENQHNQKHNLLCQGGNNILDKTL